MVVSHCVMVSHVLRTHAILLSCLKGQSVVFYGVNLYNRQCFNGRAVPSMHAEINCLRRFNKKRASGFRLLILRVSKEDDGNIILKDSRPCQGCTQFIKQKGFRQFYASTQDGKIKRYNVGSYKTYQTDSQRKFRYQGFKQG